MVKQFSMFILFFLLLIANLLLPRTNKEPLSHLEVTQPEITPTVLLKEVLYAHTTVDTLTADQRAGQRLFISIPANASESELRDIMTSIHPGGILLFSNNIVSEAQTTQLTTTLQTIAEKLGDPPLFIAVDEEGGMVERISFNQAEYSAYQLGELNDEHVARESARQTAQTLTSLGFNVNFAPVADIAFSSDSIMEYRSFGSDPTQVSELVSVTVDESLDNGILPTVKHFPGHGRTSADSHETLPIIDISKETWNESDAVPFTSAIAHGVPLIMSGHILYSSVDGNPASSSSVWLNQILREELRFNGIIVSDDIKMGAYSSGYEDTAVEFVQAGNDMIIAAVDVDSLDSIEETIKTLDPAEIPSDQYKPSLLRILRMKYRILEF